MPAKFGKCLLWITRPRFGQLGYRQHRHADRLSPNRNSAGADGNVGLEKSSLIGLPHSIGLLVMGLGASLVLIGVELAIPHVLLYVS